MLALGLLIVAISQDWHRTHPDEDVDQAIEMAARSNQPVPYGIQRLARILPYLNLWISIGSVVLLLVIWRRWNEPKRLQFPLTVAAVSIAAWAIASELVEYIAHA